MSSILDNIPYADRNPFPLVINDGVRVSKTDDGYILERLKPDLTWEPFTIGGNVSGGGNISLIDLGIIQVADVVAAGQLELLPFKAGRIIRAVYFRPDGFVPTGSVPGGSLMFFSSPNTALDSTKHYGWWNQESTELKDSFGVKVNGDALSWVADGTWTKSYDNVFLDNGPLLLVNDLSWINTTSDTPRVWEANTEYALAEYVIVGGYVQIAYTPGRSDSTEPTWNTTVGGTTSDGTITWTNVMAANIAGAIHVVVEVEDVDAADYPRPTSFEFLQQPTDVVADEVIAPAVTVRILDQNGDPYLFQSRDVIVTLAGAGTLGGQAEDFTDVATGIVTFSALTVHEPGTYTLVAKFNSWGVPYIRLVSDPFTVVSGVVGDTLTWVDQPVNSPQFASLPVSVILKDSMGDPVTGISLPITVSLVQPGTLGGTLTVHTDPLTGIATFTDLWVAETGIDWTLSATLSNLTPAVSDAFDTTVFALSDISGLARLLAADDLSLSDNDPVSTWPDTSGNGFDATAAGSARPTFKASVQNSLGVVRFDGIANGMDLEVAISAQPNTVFIVARRSIGSVIQPFFNNGSAYPYILYQSAYLLTLGEQYYAGLGGTFNQLSVIFNGASSHAWIDGSLVISGNAGGGAIAANRIGFDGSGSFMTGDYCQLVEYDTALSDENRHRVERLLKIKWDTP